MITQTYTQTELKPRENIVRKVSFIFSINSIQEYTVLISSQPSCTHSRANSANFAMRSPLQCRHLYNAVTFAMLLRMDE